MNIVYDFDGCGQSTGLLAHSVYVCTVHMYVHIRTLHLIVLFDANSMRSSSTLLILTGSVRRRSEMGMRRLCSTQPYE